MEERTLRVGEVAARTGLTVRTLHHWEEVGLVTPRRTSAGHRLYSSRELQRIQHVISLRALGFSLEEVRLSLSKRDLGLGEAIDRHIERLDEQIARQQSLRTKLHEVRRLLATGTVEIETLLDLITESTAMEKYYTKEQLEELAERAEELGEEGMAKAQQDWADLIAEFEAHMVAGTAPDDPVLKPLRDRREALINAFTGGSSAIRANLEKAYRAEGPEKMSRGMVSTDVMQYMARAAERK